MIWEIHFKDKGKPRNGKVERDCQGSVPYFWTLSLKTIQDSSTTVLSYSFQYLPNYEKCYFLSSKKTDLYGRYGSVNLYKIQLTTVYPPLHNP